jgi:hypothetical protein
MCTEEGTFVVWNKPQTIGLFACSAHLWWVKREIKQAYGSGGVERI